MTKAQILLEHLMPIHELSHDRVKRASDLLDARAATGKLKPGKSKADYGNISSYHKQRRELARHARASAKKLVTDTNKHGAAMDWATELSDKNYANRGKTPFHAHRTEKVPIGKKKIAKATYDQKEKDRIKGLVNSNSTDLKLATEGPSSSGRHNRSHVSSNAIRDREVCNTTPAELMRKRQEIEDAKRQNALQGQGILYQSVSKRRVAERLLEQFSNFITEALCDNNGTQYKQTTDPHTKKIISTQNILGHNNPLKGQNVVNKIKSAKERERAEWNARAVKAKRMIYSPPKNIIH